MKNIIITAALLSLMSGCSTIVSKSEYPVAIGSNPQSASFVVVNKAGEQVHTGITPETVTLKSSSGYFKSEAYTITFTKEGYPQQIFTIASELDGWYFGNILIGGIIGMLIVDPLTGAMYNLPESVNVSLDGSVTEQSEGNVTIKTIDSLSPAEKQRLVQIN